MNKKYRESDSDSQKEADARDRLIALIRSPIAVTEIVGKATIDGLAWTVPDRFSDGLRMLPHGHGDALEIDFDLYKAAVKFNHQAEATKALGAYMADGAKLAFLHPLEAEGMALFRLSGLKAPAPKNCGRSN